MTDEDKEVIEHIYIALKDDYFSAQGDDDYVMKFLNSN